MQSLSDAVLQYCFDAVSRQYSDDALAFMAKAIAKYPDRFDYSLLDDYINNKSLVRIICIRHGIFEQTPTDHLRVKEPCPECLKDSSRRKRQEVYIAQVGRKHNYFYDYSLMDYKSLDDHIQIVCPIHGPFVQQAEHHRLGRGCPECGRDKAKQYAAQSLGNGEAILAKCAEAHNNKYDYSLAVFTGGKRKIKIICPEHGVFEQVVDSHLRGCGCPECAIQARTRSTDEFVAQAQLAHGHYDYSQSVYRGAMQDVTIICPKHGPFDQRATSHLAGHGCPRCALVTLDTPQFIENSKKTHTAEFDYSDTVYVHSSKKVIIGCKKHGPFEQIANNHTNGAGCPKCSIESSKQEREMCRWLRELGFSPVVNDRTVIAPKEIDIWLPESRFGIEIHGAYRHSNNDRERDRWSRLRHSEKADLAQAAGIKLLQFFDFELKSGMIPESMIGYQLGLATKIVARNCRIIEVSTTQARQFLDINHLQGYHGATVYYGLLDNDRLVALMSFLRKNGEWEIQRFASLMGHVVVGGASRLFKHFVGIHQPSSVTTFVDRRFSTGQLYERLGFQFVKKTVPNYVYLGSGGAILSRHQCQKHRLAKLLGDDFDRTRSEVDNMFANGFRRLWDAGHLKLQWVGGSTIG